MFDSRFFAFATLSALLVMSPGATMAVVTDAVLAEGRLAALGTVAGVGMGNSTLALSSALGLSVVFLHWPSLLVALKVGGALYLAYLGARGLRAAWRGRHGEGAPGSRGVPGPAAWRPVSRRAAVWRGVVTNLLNPPVVLYYAVILPQFIGPGDPFFARFAVLAATHVAMSLAWLSCFSIALGFVAEHMARPGVRRSLDAVTGVVLVALGARLLVR